MCTVPCFHFFILPQTIPHLLLLPLLLLLSLLHAEPKFPSYNYFYVRSTPFPSYFLLTNPFLVFPLISPSLSLLVLIALSTPLHAVLTSCNSFFVALTLTIPPLPQLILLLSRLHIKPYCSSCTSISSNVSPIYSSLPSCNYQYFSILLLYLLFLSFSPTSSSSPLRLFATIK